MYVTSTDVVGQQSTKAKVSGRMKSISMENKEVYKVGYD